MARARPSYRLPLRFLALNILSCAGVDIFDSSSVRGIGIRFYGSDVRGKTGLGNALHRVDLQLVGHGHQDQSRTVGKGAERPVPAPVSVRSPTAENLRVQSAL